MIDDAYRSALMWFIYGDQRYAAAAYELTGAKTLPGFYRQMEYRDYLTTEHWRTMRRLAIEVAGGLCLFCYSTQRLEVHHRKYGNLGQERLSDLVVLCRDCHARHHGKLPRNQIGQKQKLEAV